jgi:hypothetical protein
MKESLMTTISTLLMLKAALVTKCLIQTKSVYSDLHYCVPETWLEVQKIWLCVEQRESVSPDLHS